MSTACVGGGSVCAGSVCAWTIPGDGVLEDCASGVGVCVGMGGGGPEGWPWIPTGLETCRRLRGARRAGSPFIGGRIPGAGPLGYLGRGLFADGGAAEAGREAGFMFNALLGRLSAYGERGGAPPP